MPNYSFIPKLQIRFSFSVHCGSQGGWKYVQSYLWGSLSQQKQRQSSESRKSHSELYSLAKDPCSAIADTTYLNGKYESFWNRKDERTSLWVATVGRRFSWPSLSCLNVWFHLAVALKALSVGESEKTTVNPSSWGMTSSLPPQTAARVWVPMCSEVPSLKLGGVLSDHRVW